MKKVLKKMKDLLVSITFSKPKEFDKLSKKYEKTKKKGGGSRKGLKCFV
ncbi:hypothetical protein [Thermodesulfovibrio hydrogeniphilus]